jgi:hypothetical protein
MATWRLRRLYHQEAGFYTCQLQSLVGMQKEFNLDDAGRMGHAAAWSESTLNMFNRQEGRLERTFYRALHELQRLRKERDTNLASVLQAPPEDHVGQVDDLPSSEISNIQPQPPNSAPMPTPAPADTP